MNQPAGHQLQPRITAGDVKLKAGLHKRKIAGAQPYVYIFLKDFAQQGFHAIDQMGYGDVAPYDHAFELVEGYFMAPVRALDAKDFTRTDDAKGWFDVLHTAYLNGAGVGA